MDYKCFCPFRATCHLVQSYPGRCPGLGASALSLRPVTVGSGRVGIILDIPGELLDVDDRTILANTLMPLGGLLHAAEAGTYATRHLVLQGNLALHTSLLGKASHAHHHRLRTAGRNHVKLLVLQHRVIGYETHLAGRAILGSDAYLSYLSKLIQLQQVGSLAGTQQEGYICTKLLDEFSEVE